MSLIKRKWLLCRTWLWNKWPAHDRSTIYMLYMRLNSKKITPKISTNRQQTIKIKDQTTSPWWCLNDMAFVVVTQCMKVSNKCIQRHQHHSFLTWKRYQRWLVNTHHPNILWKRKRRKIHEGFWEVHVVLQDNLNLFVLHAMPSCVQWSLRAVCSIVLLVFWMTNRIEWYTQVHLDGTWESGCHTNWSSVTPCPLCVIFHPCC